MKRTQAGFTLIELAIVLVIIGLLLGGVLKGQELINSAKAKSIASDFKNAQIFIYGYQDKFRALPGDDAGVVAHVGTGATLATTGGTVGNARIDGVWNSTTLTDESALFWQHVRLAGLATGPTATGDANYLPRNSDNGRIGVQSMGTGFTTITGMTGLYVVCSENIAGRLVKQIDINMDDGNTATGSLRAIVTGTATPVATTAIAEGDPYTVCMSF
ncbi:prepilin-type N-terminal cleavage/methylation domain-containing protein [Methylotenera sp. L2L1]|uniref:prepilin-type N-terminal cleavage/methylation domain-containing protein n=1 Tax=Methylotenera sp. L2L1 TaxID=1502770 RepID=UPI000568E078|nr:prepilin-type N-terminal cleavage/methylation domain-containing protein [Methylotenera sp. L2L1]